MGECSEDEYGRSYGGVDEDTSAEEVEWVCFVGRTGGAQWQWERGDHFGCWEVACLGVMSLDGKTSSPLCCGYVCDRTVVTLSDES